MEEEEVEEMIEEEEEQEVGRETEAEEEEVDLEAEEGSEGLLATDPCPGTEEIATTEEDLGPDPKQERMKIVLVMFWLIF